VVVVVVFSTGWRGLPTSPARTADGVELSDADIAGR
jgi:hypothetical protein